MTASFLLLMLASLLTLLQPRMTKWAIDIGIASKNSWLILGFAGAILVSAILSLVINYSSGVLLIRSAQHMSYDIRNALYKKVSTFSFGDFDTWRTGELIVRMNSDVNTVRMFVRMGLFMLIQSIIMLTGSLISMFMLNAQMARLIAVIMPAVLIMFFLVAKWIRPIFEQVRKTLDQVNNTLQENLAGAKLVRAFSRQEEEIRKFDQRNAAYYNISKRVSMIVGVLMPLLIFIGNMAVVTVLYSGGKLIADPAKEMSLGSLIAFSNYTLTAFFPLIMLGMVLSFLSMALASMDRIDELLQTEPSIREPSRPLLLERLTGRIVFSDVTFRYGDGDLVLERLNLAIAPGEMVGIIGTTGAGKSSLVHLIPRFYDVDEGSVELDGHDTRELSLATLRKRVTIALQDTNLFSGTIADNIRFGKPEATDEEIRKAAETACAQEFINEKEHGFNEILGEHGLGLSGGQRQRIAIARAILSDPDILILDDVTSALDAETERKIIDNLYALERRRTTIIISQKINAVKRAERILVMDRGKIVASGTHDELLASCSMYQEIYSTQNPSA